MAHFAKIENGVVQEILVVPDEQENRGQEFLANDCGLGGIWVQCSYNHNIRKKFPGIGNLFIEDNALYPRGAFVHPAPFPSWTLDDDLEWQPPTPMPEGSWTDKLPGILGPDHPDVEESPYRWDEESLSWVLIEDNPPFTTEPTSPDSVEVHTVMYTDPSN